MFGLARNFYKYVKRKRQLEMTFVLTGLDNAGKSTLLSAIKGEVDHFMTPTWGFASEKMRSGKTTLTYYDLGGGAKIRGIWSRYFANVHGIIFVLDSTDEQRFDEACETLRAMMTHECVVGKPILVFSNKQDLSDAHTPSQIKSRMGFDNATMPFPFEWLGCTALSPKGDAVDVRITKGVKWLIQTVGSQYAKLNARVSTDSVKQKEQEKKEMDEKRRRVEAIRAQRLKEAEEERLREEEELRNAESSKSVSSPIREGIEMSDRPRSSRGPNSARSSIRESGAITIKASPRPKSPAPVEEPVQEFSASSSHLSRDPAIDGPITSPDHHRSSSGTGTSELRNSRSALLQTRSPPPPSSSSSSSSSVVVAPSADNIESSHHYPQRSVSPGLPPSASRNDLDTAISKSDFSRASTHSVADAATVSVRLSQTPTPIPSRLPPLPPLPMHAVHNNGMEPSVEPQSASTVMVVQSSARSTNLSRPRSATNMNRDRGPTPTLLPSPTSSRPPSATRSRPSSSSKIFPTQSSDSHLDTTTTSEVYDLENENVVVDMYSPKMPQPLRSGRIMYSGSSASTSSITGTGRPPSSRTHSAGSSSGMIGGPTSRTPLDAMHHHSMSSMGSSCATSARQTFDNFQDRHGSVQETI